MRWRHVAWTAGACLVVAGIALPAGRLLDLALPEDATLFRADLLRGLQFFKIVLVALGAWTLLLPWVLRLQVDQHVTPKRPPLQLLNRRFHSRRMTIVLCSLLSLTAFALRWAGSGHSFSGDEVLVQSCFVDRGLPAILAYWPASTHHIGYEVFAWMCGLLPLPVEMASRLPAAVAGACAVGLCFLLYQRVVTTSVAIGVSVLHAVSVYGVVYATMLKGYTTVLLGFVIAMAAVTAIIRKPQAWRGWVGLGVSVVAMLYTHLHSALLVVGIAVAFLVLWFRCIGCSYDSLRLLLHRGLTTAISTALVVLAMYALVVPQIMTVAKGMGTRAEEPLGIAFFKGWLMQLTFWDASWPASLAVGGLALVGLVSLIRRDLSLVLLLLSPLLTVVLLTWSLAGFLYPRYMLAGLPVFLLLCGEGVAFVARRLPYRQGTVVAMAVFSMAFGLYSFSPLSEFYKYGHQDLRGAAMLVGSEKKMASRFLMTWQHSEQWSALKHVGISTSCMLGAKRGSIESRTSRGSTSILSFSRNFPGWQ